MVSRLTKKMIDALRIDYDGKLAKAYLDCILSFKRGIILGTIIRFLKAGDIQGAVNALRLSEDAFARFDMLMHQAYAEAGFAQVEKLMGARKNFAFNPRDEWSTAYSRKVIADWIQEQHNVVTFYLNDALARGVSPRQAALGVMGTMRSTTGARNGGVLGLSMRDVQASIKARDELTQGHYAQYLNRKVRDKRYDRMVRTAMKAGQPLKPEVVDNLIDRYTRNLVQHRAKMTARISVMHIIGQARENAIQQQIAAGRLLADEVEKRWRSMRDRRVRHTHRVLNGQVTPLDGLFMSPSGAALCFPGDASAPISETSGCRCWLEYRIRLRGRHGH